MPYEEVLAEENQIDDNQERVRQGKGISRCVANAQEFLHDNRKTFVKTLKGHFGFKCGSNINVIIGTKPNPKDQRAALSAVAQEVLERMDEGGKHSDKEIRRATRALKLHLSKWDVLKKGPKEKKVPEKDLPPCQ